MGIPKSFGNAFSSIRTSKKQVINENWQPKIQPRVELKQFFINILIIVSWDDLFYICYKSFIIENYEGFITNYFLRRL